jgi:hypothetical protein
VRPRTALLLVSIVAACGCRTTTAISTTPPGARIYLDGETVCPSTPCLLTTWDSPPRRHRLQIRKPTFQPVELFVDREASAPAWVAHTVLYPYLFALGVMLTHLPPEMNFVLTPKAAR